MKCLATALGTLLLALAVTPSANAVVRPEWVVSPLGVWRLQDLA